MSQRNILNNLNLGSNDFLPGDNGYLYDTDDDTEDDTDDESSMWCNLCGTMLHSSQYYQHMASHMRTMQSVNQFLHNTATFTTLLPSIPTLFPLPEFGGISFSNLFHSAHNMPLHQAFAFNYTVYNDIYDDGGEGEDYEANLRLADIIGKVEIGIEDITTVSKPVPKESLEDDVSCPICIEKIKDCDGECLELVCSHKYCDKCISKWLKKSKRCPVCNIDLGEKRESATAVSPNIDNVA